MVVGGRPEPIIAERFPQYLNRPDIQWLSWSNDVGEYFRSADVFAFPSLEEGSPLVIYEAMGCGLPAVASPMGGGAIGWQGEGIIILDPYDVDAWAETFRRLGTDHAYRRELAEQGAPLGTELHLEGGRSQASLRSRPWSDRWDATTPPTARSGPVPAMPPTIEIRRL